MATHPPAAALPDHEKVRTLSSAFTFPLRDPFVQLSKVMVQLNQQQQQLLLLLQPPQPA